MTEYEQTKLFKSLEKITDLLQDLVDINHNIVVGIDSAKDGASDFTAFVTTESVEDAEQAESRKASVAKADRDRYNEYKAYGGELKWNEWRKKDKETRVS